VCGGWRTLACSPTTVVQLTADALGVDIDDVSTIQGDTAIAPNAPVGAAAAAPS